MSFSKTLLFILAASSSLSSHAFTIERRDGTPGLPYDENTTKECTWWIDYDGSLSCAPMLEDNFTNLQDFRRWNPTIGPDCEGLTSGKSYCVEAQFETPPAVTSQTPTTSSTLISTTTTKTSSSSTKPIASSTTSAGNGVATPQPTQPGMVTNCAGFHWIAPGVTCGQVISFQKITLAEFVRWNPTVGNDCTGMQANVNVCVRVIGGTTTAPTTVSTKPSPTTTTGNGVATPQPTQPGMVTNCAKFHWIAPGVSCSQVISFQKITLLDFVRWNPTVGNDCTGMQANVNVCVGIIGGTKAPTTTPTSTTSAGNGIQTPQPTQPGMVTNCKKFHYAETGVVCSQITSFNNISLADFVKWNSGVGPDCRGMWAKTFTCVGV
ncbi:hypothetical protein G6011_09423 [Alternaria panax]|uniref:LysM domain-containing protein n=1 Tax=Alternaria panax TaxID=48097 RepID=A0AAD4NRB6_9PLEO|nr:hypothetical protein G6011_09423 [Alternaria panax]